MPLLTLPFTTMESEAPAESTGAMLSAGVALAPAPAAFTSAFWNPPVCWGTGVAPGLPLAGFLPLAAAGAAAGEFGAGAAAAVPVVAVDAAGAAGVGGAIVAFISAKVSSFSSHLGLGASGATATSLVIGENVCISTLMDQTPSAKSGNVYAPLGSVTAVKLLSPCVAVTVAPGSGSPPNVTVP